MLRIISKFILICIFISFPKFALGQDNIKVGVIYAFSGLGQVWSDYGRMGLELARDEINSNGGIKGKKIQLIFEDSQTEPAKSVSAYRKLVATDKVKFIIGNVWSFITNPIIPLLAKDKVVLISPTVMEESVEKTSPWFFTLGYKVAGMENAVNRFFELNPGIKSVGILCWDDMWGLANLDLWHRVLAKHRIEISQEICMRDYTTPLATEMTKIAAKKPDAVLISFGAERALARMRELNFQAKVLTTSDMVEAMRVRGLSNELAEGVFFMDWPPDQAFVKKFEARFDKHPILEAHNSYESLHSLAKALEADTGDILSALSKVRYQGVGGEIDFSKGSFGNQGLAELFKVTAGKFAPIR